MLKGVIFFLLCLDAAMYLWVPQGKTLAFRIGLGCMLGMPLIMAGSQGAALGRMRPIRSRQRGPITFLAIRPILTGDMLDAKYRMITRNVIQIWLMTLAITGAVVLVKGQAHDVAGDPAVVPSTLSGVERMDHSWPDDRVDAGLHLETADGQSRRGAHGPALACRRSPSSSRLTS